MEKTQIPKSFADKEEELVASLPRVTNWDGLFLYNYQGFWLPQRAIKGFISFQKNFEAKPNDIILVTSPKSGTTWLKALAFAIVHRNKHNPTDPLHPLLTTNSHQLIKFFEFDLYAKNECPNLEEYASPRIFATHAALPLLPRSVKDSSCRMVYLCRNPLDQFVSHWIFLNSLNPEVEKTVTQEEAVEMFCKGIQGSGPIWDHLLGYWYESLEKPNSVLFLRYEDLKGDGVGTYKKLAEFLGFPFSEEEEKQGVIEDISKLCSFENLKVLEVNKIGEQPWGVANNAFFRNGKVGDWTNHLSPAVAQKIEKVMEDKFAGSGLIFSLSSA